MKLFIFLLLILLANVAQAEPTVQAVIKDDWSRHTIEFDSSTSQTRSIPVGTSCSVNVNYSGAGKVELHSVDSTTDEFYKGSLVGVWSASTVKPFNFSASKRYVKARAFSASDGTVMTITCSNKKFTNFNPQSEHTYTDSMPTSSDCSEEGTYWTDDRIDNVYRCDGSSWSIDSNALPSNAASMAVQPEPSLEATASESLTAYETDLVNIFDNNAVTRPGVGNTGPQNATPPFSAGSPGIRIYDDGIDTCNDIATAFSSSNAYIQLRNPNIYFCSASQLSITGNDLFIYLAPDVELKANDGNIVFSGSRVTISKSGLTDGGSFTVSGSTLGVPNSILITGDNYLITDTNFYSEQGNALELSGASDIRLWRNTFNGGANALKASGTSTNHQYLANSFWGGEYSTEPAVQIEDLNRFLFANNHVQNKTGDSSIFNLWSSNQNQLITDNYFSTFDSSGFNMSITSRCPSNEGSIDNVHVLDNFFFNTGDGTSVIEAGYQTTGGCSDTCAGLTIDGNAFYTDNGTPSFGVSTLENACTSLTNTNNTAADLSDNYANGVPDCTDLTDCGSGFIARSGSSFEEPYDLHPYEERMDQVFGSNPPSWPRIPDITRVVTIDSDTCSTLNSSLAVAGTKVELDADITNCSFEIAASNTWLEMTDTASVSGPCNGGQCVNNGTSRVKITGGALNFTGQNFFRGSDFLMKNVVFDIADAAFDLAHTSPYALVNNTITANQYALFSTGDPKTDIIVVKNDFQGSDPASTDQEANTRVANMTRALFAGNFFKPQNVSFQSRWWKNHQDLLLVDNTFVKLDSPVIHLWLGSDAGDSQCGDQSNFWVTENNFYSNTNMRGTTGLRANMDVDCPTNSCEYTVIGNTAYEDPDPSTFGFNTISGTTACSYTNDVAADNSTALFITAPDCSTLGCGADH